MEKTKMVFTKEETAEKLGVSIEIVEDFINSGDLPAIGSLKNYIKLCDINKFMGVESAVSPVDISMVQRSNDYTIDEAIKIDMQNLEMNLEMKKRKEILSKHPFSIYQGKDGKFYTYLPKKDGSRIKKKRNTRKEIEDLVIDFWKAEEENPTLQEVFDEWNKRRLDLKHITDPTYSRHKRTFSLCYGEIKDMKIKDISPDFLETFIQKMVPDKKLTSREFANMRSITKGFIRKSIKDKKIEFFDVDAFFKGLELPRNIFRVNYKEECQEVFDKEEMEKMILYLRENLDIHNLGIMVALLTGLRVGEIVALKHENLIGKNEIKIRFMERKIEKEGGSEYIVVDSTKTTAGYRSVIMPPDYEWVIDKLREQNSAGEYIFVNKGKRMTTNCIRQRMYRVCKKLDIYQKSPHKARKTYGTILLDNKLDNRMITGLMGHTNISCTEGHYHRDRKSIDQKSKILGNISDFQVK